MTVNAVRRNRRRMPALPAERPVTESIAIGEINQTVFDCPSCARPLVLGTKRCPSCGTHLIIGVATSKAAVIAGLGLAVGLLAGGTIGFTAGLTRAPAAVAAIVVPSAGPVVGAAPTSAPLLPTTSPTAIPVVLVPPLSRSALVQAVGVNTRLAAGAAALQASLEARAFDASGVAQTLRTISGDSVFGQQLAMRMSDWPAGAPLGRNLNSFYDGVHQAAIDALVASVRDDVAYRSAARTMIRVLAGLPALDSAARSVAAGIGLDVAASAAP
ncbi:MAG TPA: hypothetical protein VHS36_04055 [Candidatus Limnocylindrales bacterium]|nr:hypothetical protein [Candidatus Limnocylindrales bacterium]